MGWFIFVIILIYLVTRPASSGKPRRRNTFTGGTDTDTDNDYFNDYLEMDLMTDGEINGR